MVSLIIGENGSANSEMARTSDRAVSPPEEAGALPPPIVKKVF